MHKLVSTKELEEMVEEAQKLYEGVNELDPSAADIISKFSQEGIFDEDFIDGGSGNGKTCVETNSGNNKVDEAIETVLKFYKSANDAVAMGQVENCVNNMMTVYYNLSLRNL